MANEITKGTRVLVKAEVGKAFTPMGRDYQLAWLTEGKVQFRPEELISLDDLREVLLRARSKALHPLRTDMGTLTWTGYEAPLSYHESNCQGCTWEAMVDAFLDRLNEAPR